MSTRSIGPLTLLLALALAACRAQRSEEGGPDTAPRVSPSADDTGRAAAARDTASRDSVRAPVRGLPPRVLDSFRRPHVDPPPRDVRPLQTPSAEPRAATVRELLDSDALVGERVRVTGRCLGYGANRALGPSPRSRSDWELEAGGAAIWVSGPLPEGCSSTGGSTQATTLTGVVRQDTVPAFGNRPARPRRYLVVSG